MSSFELPFLVLTESRKVSCSQSSTGRDKHKQRKIVGYERFDRNTRCSGEYSLLSVKCVINNKVQQCLYLRKSYLLGQRYGSEAIARPDQTNIIILTMFQRFTVLIEHLHDDVI